MPELIDHPSWIAVRRPGGWRELASWASVAGVYAAAQGLSAWAGQRSAGQRSAGQRSAGQGSAGQGSAGQGSAGQGSAGQGSAGQRSAGQGGARRGTRDQYQDFRQPSFAPPGPVFPVVWSALNLTTATSAWRLWRARRAPGPEVPHAQSALTWWALAVLLRSWYVPLEFGARRHWAATADSALLCAVMVRYATVARRADPAAAALAAPEIAWTAFATALSAAIARQNP